MSWAVGYDSNWRRDIGYGVPSRCDHPECDKDIDRGLSYVCGGRPYGGEHGCGLYFCGSHLYVAPILDEGEEEDEDTEIAFLCERCRDKQLPFDAKPDVPKWVNHKLTHPSWAKWREENKDWVEAQLELATPSTEADDG